jgi:hypothetical protein
MTHDGGCRFEKLGREGRKILVKKRKDRCIFNVYALLVGIRISHARKKHANVPHWWRKPVNFAGDKVPFRAPAEFAI